MCAHGGSRGRISSPATSAHEPDTLGDVGGEAKFAPAGDGPIAQLVHQDSFLIDLKNYNTPNYRTLAYAFVWINSPDDRKGLLGINSDDGNAVWLNGQQIWKNNVSRSVPKPGQKRRPARY